ncbi:MFS transporter [Sphingomonas mali]|uniref:MFS transporter n=1 Tax=Sphingomonas mali TaxID=40682 RepID=UPI0008319237|nr:MFS transporter [Sphingomonas mali]
MSDQHGQGYAELRQHWPLIVAVMIGSAAGPTVLIPYTAGIFIPALQHEFGWSRGALSFGFTIYGLMMALTAPAVGSLADRHGVAVMVPLSLVATVAAFVAFAALPNSYPAFLAIFAVLGLLGAGASSLVMSRILTGAFDAARGAALGLGLLGVGITSMLAPRLLGNLIDAEGWRVAYLALAGLVALCIPLIAIPVARHPSCRASADGARRQVEQGGLGEVLRSSVFWKLGLAFFLIQISATGNLFHFIPMLLDQGVPRSEATLAAGLIGAVMIVARLSIGFVIDRLFAPRVATVVSLVAALGIGTLAVGASWSAIVGAVAVGLVIGAEFDLAAYLVSRYFPPALFGRAYGLLWMIMVGGTISSTSLYGLSVDLTGGYGTIQAAATAGIACSALLFLLLPAFNQSLRHQQPA